MAAINNYTIFKPSNGTWEGGREFDIVCYLVVLVEDKSRKLLKGGSYSECGLCWGKHGAFEYIRTSSCSCSALIGIT